MYINLWKNNNYIITYEKSHNIYDLSYKISILDENDNILKTHKLDNTRILLGVITIPDKNLYIYVHYKFLNNERSLIIDYYKIDDNLNISKVKDYVINYDYSCNNLEGKLYCLNNKYYIILGDPSNYDYLSLVKFDENKIIYKENRNYFNLKSNYMISENIIIESQVTAYDNCKLNISLINILSNSKISMITNIILPYSHNFNLSDVESRIINFHSNDYKLCLLRVNLEDKIDVLHIDYYYIDILIDIKNHNILSISNKIKESDYDIDSSIAFDNESKPYIWFKDLDLIIPLIN